ncbi:MAG TPA: tetratricopeptide repeat protein [Acidobacteriota bacterium]|nr:tetratricopeptide repeat protein [Acidobacteriota bacterium]
MVLKVKSVGEWAFVLTALVIVAGFAFWQSDLTSDPPMYFSGIGQSLSTDPYMYSLHARNRILFGEFDPLNDPRWIVFQKSLVSLVSCLWLRLTDVTLREANTVGVLLSIAGMFLVLLALVKYHRPWVTAAVALCYLINVTLLTYGRLPYLENGLIFWAGLAFLIWTRWGDRISGAAAAGAVAALAAVTGKLFGALLVPTVVLSILALRRPEPWKHIAATLIGFIAAGAASILLLYGGHASQAVQFFTRESFGLHGFPDGLKSPWAFAEHLVSFGFDNHLYYLNPDLLLFLVAGGLFFVFRGKGRKSRIENLPPTMVYSLFWILSGWISLMPLNYSPLRYSLFFVPAVIVFCFTTLDWSMRSQPLGAAGWRKTGGWLAVLLFWMLTFHTVMNAWFFNDVSAPRRLIVWLSLAAGLGLALATRQVIRSRPRLFSRATVIMLATLLVGTSALVNGFRVRRKHFLDHHFSVAEANSDMGQILGPGAVVAGPYAPTLTFQTEHQSVIHFFGATRSDSGLFDSFPITHVAADLSNWRAAVVDFPALAGLKPVASYWIRDYLVELYNVSKTFPNVRANAYAESPYERAANYFQRDQIDSALAALDSVPMMVNSSKAAGILYSRLMQRKQQYDHVLQLLTELAERFPTDFSLQLECGHFLQRLALTRQDRLLLYRAQKYYERATILNPYKADYANSLYAQTLARMSGSPSGTGR